MIKELNFFRYDVESTEIYGSVLDNGTLVGMVGLVHRQVTFCALSRWENKKETCHLSCSVTNLQFYVLIHELHGLFYLPCQ